MPFAIRGVERGGRHRVGHIHHRGGIGLDLAGVHPDLIVAHADQRGELRRPLRLPFGKGAKPVALRAVHIDIGVRSEEHTSELQSLMRISYAVFCLKKKTQSYKITITYDQDQNNMLEEQTIHSTTHYDND